jgi:hypothetical protein
MEAGGENELLNSQEGRRFALAVQDTKSEILGWGFNFYSLWSWLQGRNQNSLLPQNLHDDKTTTVGIAYGCSSFALVVS